MSEEKLNIKRTTREFFEHGVTHILRNHLEDYSEGSPWIRISDDISKIQFDFENVTWETTRFPYSDEVAGLSQIDDKYFWIVWAGGDWEEDVAFIIYYDGSHFRGYVPEDGNTYNKFFNTAFGSEEESKISIESVNDYPENIRKEIINIMTNNPEMSFEEASCDYWSSVADKTKFDFILFVADIKRHIS